MSINLSNVTTSITLDADAANIALEAASTSVVLDTVAYAGSGSLVTLGTPTDGSWADGLVASFTAATSVADAIDGINEAAKAITTGGYTFTTITVSGPTVLGELSGTSAAFSGPVSGTTGAFSSNATVGGTLGVTGAVTGASYSGGTVTGTTGTFTSTVTGSVFLSTGATQQPDAGAKFSAYGVTGVASGNAYYYAQDAAGTNKAYFGVTASTAFMGAYNDVTFEVRRNNTARITLGSTTITMANQVALPAGSNTAPSLAVGGEQTGLYLVSTGVLGVAIAGTSLLKINVLSAYVQYQNTIGSGGSNGFSWYAGNNARVLNIDTTNGLIITSRDGLVVQGGSGGNFGQSSMLTCTISAVVTLSGATTSVASMLPANAWILGTSLLVKTTVTGATSFSMGTATNATAFGTGISTVATTATNIGNWTIAGPLANATLGSIIFTAAGGNFTGGTVRVVVTYLYVANITS